MCFAQPWLENKSCCVSERYRKCVGNEDIMETEIVTDSFALVNISYHYHPSGNLFSLKFVSWSWNVIVLSLLHKRLDLTKVWVWVVEDEVFCDSVNRVCVWQQKMFEIWKVTLWKLIIISKFKSPWIKNPKPTIVDLSKFFWNLFCHIFFLLPHFTSVISII